MHYSITPFLQSIHVAGKKLKVRNHRSPCRCMLVFRDPHLILLAPGIIRLPDLESDRVLPAGFGNESFFSGVRHLDAGYDENFLRYSFVDEDAVALAHRRPSFSSTLHTQKL